MREHHETALGAICGIGGVERIDLPDALGSAMAHAASHGEADQRRDRSRRLRIVSIRLRRGPALIREFPGDEEQDHAQQELQLFRAVLGGSRMCGDACLCDRIQVTAIGHRGKQPLSIIAGL